MMVPLLETALNIIFQNTLQLRHIALNVSNVSKTLSFQVPPPPPLFFFFKEAKIAEG
jgi:hypothetical protein